MIAHATIPVTPLESDEPRPRRGTKRLILLLIVLMAAIACGSLPSVRRFVTNPARI